jgi:hypothetical protein
MKKQIVLAVFSLVLSIYAMAEITPAYGQVASLNVSPGLPVANQPITFSGIAEGGAYVFVYASSACPGMGNSAIQPIISLSSVSDQRHGAYSVILWGGLPAGSYSVLAFNDFNVQQGTAPCRSFTVLASKPVPEFGGDKAVVAFLALAASLCILRRRQVKMQ